MASSAVLPVPAQLVEIDYKPNNDIMKKLLLALLFAGGAVAAEAEEARLLRFPATNGRDVVFTYAGDLYRVPITGGEATRLTSHVGTEMFARFSPDGEQIAFTAQYDGNTEVYYLKNVTAQICSFTEAPREIKF